MTALLADAATFRYGALSKVGFIVLVYADLVLTLWAAQLGFTELNPIMARLLEQPGQLLLIKVAAPVLLAWLTPGRLLLPSILFLIGVLTWNLTQLVALF